MGKENDENDGSSWEDQDRDWGGSGGESEDEYVTQPEKGTLPLEASKSC